MSVGVRWWRWGVFVRRRFHPHSSQGSHAPSRPPGCHDSLTFPYTRVWAYIRAQIQVEDNNNDIWSTKRWLQKIANILKDVRVCGQYFRWKGTEKGSLKGKTYFFCSDDQNFVETKKRAKMSEKAKPSRRLFFRACGRIYLVPSVTVNE